MRQKRRVVFIFDIREAEEHGIVAQLGRQLRLRDAWLGFPHTPAIFTTSFPRLSSAARLSTGFNNPTFGSRIANWVVWTPTATPPAPAAR